MSKLDLENLLKNLILLACLIFFYYPIENSLVNSSIASDKAVLGSLLIAVSILIVTASFGAFGFTYEKVEHNKFVSRFLAHITTAVLILLIGLCLEITSVIVRLLMGEFFIFDLSLILLYLGVILYDLWDLKRAKLSA